MKITVFWLAWSGTSTIGKLLWEKLDYKFMSSWNIMRSWADNLWYTIYDFENKVIKTDKSFDIKLDNKVWDFWEQNDDFIFESRLAWHFIPDSFKIFLHCDDRERYRRIQTREKWNLEDIVQKTQKREDDLVIRYKEVYPDIVFPPKKEEFDLFIDATSISPDEIVDKILEKIK